MRNNKKRAFTLIEILISIFLLSIVLVGLYGVLDTQRRSVSNIKEHLDKSIDHDRAIMVLYNDILKSDGNLTIKKGLRDTLCINKTINSLYELGVAKVCWLVLKDKDTLVRIEGNGYNLPLGIEDKVALNRVLEGVKVFEVARDKDKVFVYAQQLNKEPYTFLLQGIKIPPKPKKKPKKKKPKNQNIINPKKGGEQNITNPKKEDEKRNQTKPKPGEDFAT